MYTLSPRGSTVGNGEAMPQTSPADPEWLVDLPQQARQILPFLICTIPCKKSGSTGLKGTNAGNNISNFYVSMRLISAPNITTRYNVLQPSSQLIFKVFYI